MPVKQKQNTPHAQYFHFLKPFSSPRRAANVTDLIVYHRGHGVIPYRHTVAVGIFLLQGPLWRP